MEHPLKFIDSQLTDTIRKLAAEAETLRNLHPDQIAVIQEQRWLNMFVPKELGGLALSLSEGVRIEESLSWADGSTGWLVTLCSGAAWFAGFLQPAILLEIFAHGSVCFAGSGAATGTARVTETGYEVSGYWKYASGSLLATVFTANCVITKDGVPLRNKDGSPVVRAFVFKKDEVKLHHTWNSMGMIATGSHGFEIVSVPVDHNRSFIIDAEHAIIKQALYQFPFLQLAEVTLAVNLSGMAIRFMDLCEGIFEERIKHNAITESQKTSLTKMLAEACSKIQQSRQEFYQALDASWEMISSGTTIPDSQLEDLSKGSHRLAKISRQCVDSLYPSCGLQAANTTTEINRVWRNFHTASQHNIFLGSGRDQ